MKSAQNEPLHVLRFWRDLEVFNIPEAPSRRDNTKQTTVNDLRRGEALPWKLRQFAPTAEYGYVHLVCLGVANMESLSRLLIQSIFPDLDLSERERQNSSGKGWIAAFVVDELGRAKLDSYLPASFAQGVAALREAGTLDNINASLERAKEEFAKRRHPITDQSEQKVQSEQSTPGVQANTALDWRDLDEETRIARSLFGEAANDPRLDWHVVVRTGRVQRRYLDETLQAANDFMNSFYLDDLDRLIAQAGKKLPFGNALRAYLGPALPDHQRIDILTDHAAMSERVTAKRLPSARWPSSPKHPLVLAQQAAVSQIIASLGKDEGLIGVNGPPGTGKTTLLCDVIAEIVTERARRLAGLDRPGDVFTDKMIVAGKGFYPIKAEVISGTSIVVSSTNNNAVKNITQELPARKKVADEFSPADYFADVMREVFRAQKVVGEDNQPIETWGVIAAALGNANNRRAFAQGFFRDESPPSPQRKTEPTQGENRRASADSSNAQVKKPAPADDPPPSMKQILEAASAQYQQHQDAWQKARQDFMRVHTEFEICRDVLDRAEKAALHLDDARRRLEPLQAEEDELRRDIQARNLELAQQREDVNTQRTVVDGHRTMVMQLRADASPNLVERLMRLFGRETRRMEALRKSLAAPTRALATASSALAEKTALRNLVCLARNIGVRD